MKTELTNYCSYYYDLMLRLQQQEARFNMLLENALPYTGQILITELDAIIRCNRKIQKARATADETRKAMNDIGRTIVQIMEYFQIPPLTTLTCEVPGEYELAIWADDEKTVHCLKTKDLAPLEDDPHIIRIKLCTSPYPINDDEDDD